MGSVQFLINIIFDVYIFVFILRMLFYMFHAGYYNPIVQFIVKVTQPLVKPLQKIFPRKSRIEWAVIFWIIVLGCIKVWILFALYGPADSNILGRLFYSIFYSVISAIDKVLTFYFYAIIVQAILSWFPQMQRNLVFATLSQLTEPVLNIFRRFIPLLGPLDLSPLAALVAIKLIQAFIIYPLLLA